MGGLRYLSVCSGIEAASVAWHPLGWEPVAFAENDRFPSAVLAHHYPTVPNLGDITKFRSWPDADFDVLVGGTPCQSFSVAGLRKGLADPRGNLALVFLAIAERYQPRWIIWENVPGVLSSSEGRDFGSFLGGVGELGYGWAYRVLDAQHVRVDGLGRAVPQRRRRVFVVGHLGDWRCAAAVLFERESVCGHSPPRRETGEGLAPTIAARTKGGGGLGTDFDCDVGLIARILLGKENSSHAADAETYVIDDIARCVTAGYSQRIDAETENFVAHSLRAEGFDASEDGTGRGTPLVPVVAGTLKSCGGKSGQQNGAELADQLVAFDSKASGRNGFGIGEISPTLRAMGHKDSHTNAGGQVAVAFTQNSRSEVREIGGDGSVVGALAAEPGVQQQNYVSTGWQVRRLTPVECERLQGFPDDYTLIPHRGKPAADGPRYKALGNSFAVNVVRWLGRRIQMVEELEARDAKVA